LYANVSKTTTSFLDSGLVNGTNYYYRIKSIDSSGLSSAYSQNYTITPTNIWYVSSTGLQTGFGSTTSPMNSIQTAINSSVNGEVIKVSNGTYFESINFNGKSVVIESNFATTNDVLDIENTIINGNNLTFPVVNFSNSENQNSKLIGFKIINGNGKNIVGNWGLGTHGGGVFIKNASPTIKNCNITNNNCQNGGGIYAENSQSIFENLLIHGNNLNQQNIPNGGSGLFLLNCNLSIFNCKIYNNSDNPTNGVSNYGGGGILIFGGSANIISSKILNNTSKGYGGGISLLSGASAIFDNSIISNNNGGLNGNYTGGGIYSDNCNITLKNCVLWGNTKNGISINGYPNVSILNSIIYNNTPNQIVGGFNNNITFSDIQGGHAGLGNININPSFVNPISNDFNIRPYSQCIGLGSNIGINQFDINMQNRPTPLGSNCDIGAYELIQGTPSNAPPSLIAPLIHSSIEDSLSKIFLTNINDGDLFNTQNISLTILSGNSSILNNFQVALNQQQDSAVISYIPITNQNGNVPVTIIIKDNGGILNNGLDSSIVNLNISVSAVNDLPIAINDTINTSEDITATINLLLNDSDVDNTINATTIDLNQITPGVQNSINNPSGVWSVNNQGLLTFSPALNYNGTSTIQYTVIDASSGVSNVAQVIVQVSSVNDAPIASNDVLTTLEDTPVTLNLLSNDSDIDNTIDSSSIDLDLTATGIQNTVTTVGGVLSVTSTGVLNFTPNLNYNGVITRTYKVNDVQGLQSNAATITITVSAVNDLPIAINDTINTSEDITATINLLLNDSDVDNTLNAATIDLNQITPGVQNSINNLAGVWSVNNQGVLTFSPALNYNGISTIQYTVNDASSGVSNVAQVFAQVSSVNDAPIASNDVITTLEDTPVMLDLLMNDSDIDNALDSSSIDLDLTATGIQNTVTTVGGVLSVTSTGVLNFTPNLNYNGVITRTYKVNDVLGLQSNTATITITVSAVNDLPDSIYLSNNTQFENQIGGIGLLTTIDVDNNQTYTYSLVSGIGSNDNLSFSIINNQLQNIIPFNFESNNQLSIRVKSTDNGGLSKEIIFLVNVLNVNDIQVIDTINNTFCNGTNGSGAINISYLETNGSVNFNWTGPNSFIATTQNISGLESGLYTLNLSDSLDTVIFNYNLNQTPIYNDLNICFVSSDSLLGNLNRIYFNNPSMYNVEFFEILKESSVQGVYNVIDQISSTDSSFLDLTSNNQVQNYSYKIRSIDSCGNYSNLSLEHKTILLQSNISANNSVNLLWTPYVGITYGTYYVYRSVNNNPYTLLVSLPSSQLNYNDISADVLTNSYKYFVSITTAGCDFTKSTNLIRSNIELVSSVSVKINESLDISISPNPSNGLYKIQNNSNYLISNYFVYNNEGQIILEDDASMFDLSQFENGFYFLEIVLNNGYRFKRKLVKN